MILQQNSVQSSLLVLCAVMCSYFGATGDIIFGLTVDQLAAGLMLPFIGYAGLELLVNGMRVLLDAAIHRFRQQWRGDFVGGGCGAVIEIYP